MTGPGESKRKHDVSSIETHQSALNNWLNINSASEALMGNPTGYRLRCAGTEHGINLA